MRQTDSDIPSSQSRRTMRAKIKVMIIETHIILSKLCHMFFDVMRSMQKANVIDSMTPYIAEEENAFSVAI